MRPALEQVLSAARTAMDRAAGARAVPGNKVELLVDGPEAYQAMFDIIADARAWIHFENYIIRSDQEGWRFAELLARRAREGVRVRVLYDWFGSFSTRGNYWTYLRDAGCEVRAFNRFSLLDLARTVSRNHRKLVVTDGRRAVIGGLCIGVEWTGAESADGQPWRDTAVRVDGPAAAVLDQSFARTWSVAGGSIPPQDVAAEVPAAGDAEVRVIVGEPGRARAFRTMEILTMAATQRLWITDAYMMAPARLFNAFRDAARDGVDVRLLVPGTSDLPLVRNLTRIGYRNLLRAGVRIFEWDGPMLHAKSLGTDGRWVRIGSTNLNTASLVGNYELDVLVDDPRLAEALDQQFRLDMSRSREVTRRPMRVPHRLGPRISQRLPVALEHIEAEHPVDHAVGLRERRERAVLALRSVMANAQRSVYLPLMALFVLLGALLFLLPRFTSYFLGVVSIWVAVTVGREAFRRRIDR